MEYRYSFFMQLLIQIFSHLINYLGIWVLLSRFHRVQDWSYFEVMFLYNLNLCSYGLAGFFLWSPMRQLGRMVQQGTFDGILVYPLNSLLHLAARHFNAAFLGHLALSGVIFTVCLGKLSIDWTIAKVAWFILVILGATLIQASVMIVSGTMSFWIIKSTALVDVAVYAGRSFINYPITVYDKWVQVVLTFLLPYAFVSFFPAQYFLNKTEEATFHSLFQFGTPLVGIVTFLLACRLWNLGINHYQSTGS